MYLLFVFPEPPEGYSAGGMNDFAGFFDCQGAAMKYAESQLWHEGSRAQIVGVSMGLATERRAYGTVAECPILDSLTVVLEGRRLGHHEGSLWEWEKVKEHYPVTEEQIEPRGHDAPFAYQKAVEDFLERNPAFHAALKGVAPSLFGESESRDL